MQPSGSASTRALEPLSSSARVHAGRSRPRTEHRHAVAFTTRGAPRVAPSDDRHLRLRLKPRGAVTGFVDGGWWPRSRDLPAELPALLAVLAVRLGPVESVSYNLDAWGPTPRKLTLDGRLVRLAGHRAQHTATIDVLSAGHRLTLLVVPPEATPEAAHGALMAAGRRANTDRVDALLSPAPRTPPTTRTRWRRSGGISTEDACASLQSMGWSAHRVPDRYSYPCPTVDSERVGRRFEGRVDHGELR